MTSTSIRYDSIPQSALWTLHVPPEKYPYVEKVCKDMQKKWYPGIAVDPKQNAVHFPYALPQVSHFLKTSVSGMKEDFDECLEKSTKDPEFFTQTARGILSKPTSHGTRFEAHTEETVQFCKTAAKAMESWYHQYGPQPGTWVKCFQPPAEHELPIETSKREKWALYQKLLNQYSGISFGDSHDTDAAQRLLIESMEAFAILGVKALFLEGFSECQQAWIDEYFAQKDGIMPQPLREHISEMDKQWKLTDSPYSTLNLFRAAHKVGIKIIGLETQRTLNTIALGFVNALKIPLHFARTITTSYEWPTIIQKFRNENPNAKFLLHAGANHIIESFEVAGMNDLLQIPSIGAGHDLIEHLKKEGTCTGRGFDFFFRSEKPAEPAPMTTVPAVPAKKTSPIAKPSAAPSLNVTSVNPSLLSTGPNMGQNFLAEARRNMFEAEKNIVKYHTDIEKAQTDPSILAQIQTALSQLTQLFISSKAKLDFARVNNADVSEALLDLESLHADQRCLQTRINIIMRQQKPNATSPQQTAIKQTASLCIHTSTARLPVGSMPSFGRKKI